MPNVAISALTALGAAPATNDLFVLVDISDISQAATGSTKSVTGAFLFTTPSFTTSATVTGASAVALAIGLNGATNPAFVVDASTATQAAGLKVTGAAAAGTVAVAVISSGSNASLTLNAKGTGTIGIGSVSTGAVTITPAVTLSNGATVTTGGLTVSAGTSAVQALTATTGAFSSTLSATAISGTSITGSLNVTAGASSFFVLSGRSTISAASDGVLMLANNSANDFTRLQFGGTTSSFPSLKRSTTTLAVRLADDSADAGITASTGAFSSTLSVTGDVAVNTNKFTVAASSGNALVAGTLGVTGATTLAVLTATGTVTFSGIVNTQSLLNTAASTTGTAGLTLPHGTAPTSPVNGDLWTTTAGMFVRINGVSKTVTLT